jgi:hypothetical protein
MIEKESAERYRIFCKAEKRVGRQPISYDRWKLKGMPMGGLDDRKYN